MPIPTVPSPLLVGIPIRERRLEIIPISPHSHVVAGWMREVDGNKAGPSAGRPNLTEPKMAVAVKIIEQNLTKATHNPRQDHACGSRFRPYVHVYMYTCNWNLETQTDRQSNPSRGHQAAYSEVQVYLREAGTHTHTRTSNGHSHDTTACRAQHTCSYIHAYMHITNSPNPSCSPLPCISHKASTAQHDPRLPE